MNKITRWLLLAILLGQTLVYAAPIHDAANSGDLPKVMELIEGNKDVVNATDKGFTALMDAARKGHLEVIKALLAAGANIDAQHSHRGLTSLMYAVINEHPDIVKFLLQNGARIELVTSNGQTAISKANPEWGNSNGEILDDLRQCSIVGRVKITNPKEIIILDGNDPDSYERDFVVYGIKRKAAVEEATGIHNGPASIIYQYLGEE